MAFNDIERAIEVFNQVFLSVIFPCVEGNIFGRRLPELCCRAICGEICLKLNFF